MNPLATYLSSVGAANNSAFNSFVNNIRAGAPAPQTPLTPKTSVTPSNVSATSQLSTTTYGPAQPASLKTPAAQNYINNYAGSAGITLTPEQKATNDAMTKSGNYALNNSSTNTQNPIPQTETSTPTTPSDPYLAYLSSLFTSDNVNAARDTLTSSNQRLAEIQNNEEIKSLAARRANDAELDTPGRFQSANVQDAGVTSRRNNSELADLAVQEGAAARSAQVAQDTYNRYIDAGKTVYEANQAAKAAQAKSNQDNSYTLSPGQTRFDANGNPVASVAPSANTGTNSGTYVEGQNPTVDAWIKHVNSGGKITDVPPALKGLVVQGLSSGDVAPSSLIKDAYTQAQDLFDTFDSGKGAIGAKGISSLFGILGSPIAGSAAEDYKNKLDSFKAKLSLDSVKYLKGQGAVSDAERKLLADSVTELGTNQSEDAFKKTLTNIISVLKNKVGDNSGGLAVTDPNGGVHTFKTIADANAFKKAIGQ